MPWLATKEFNRNQIPMPPMDHPVESSLPWMEAIQIYPARQEQLAFHHSMQRIRFLRGGVGGGKTIAGAAEAILLAARNPGCDGLIVAPHWSTLQRVTLREFKRLLPSSLLQGEMKQERYLELINGARIYYGSADQPETLEGSNLAWAWGDEARYWRKEAWNILIARVRDPRAKRLGIVITSTPSMGWLYEEFGNDRPDAESFVMPTATNPYLPEGYLDALKRRYSPSLFRQYCNGEWVQLEGAVFDDFDPEAHVQDLAVVSTLPVHMGLDFGYRKPAVLYFQHLAHCDVHGIDDCIHILDEDMPENLTTGVLAERIIRQYRIQNWQRGTCYCDPAGTQVSQEAGFTGIDALEAKGFYVEYTTSPELRRIPCGIDLIRGKLENSLGERSLFFHRRLQGVGHERGILEALLRTAYPEVKDHKPLPDAPIKDGVYDHALDALRYSLINLFPPERHSIRLH